MFVDAESVVHLNIGRNLMYPRIAELFDFSTVGTNEMVVLLAFVGFLKLCNVFIKQMFHNKIGLKQQLNGIVQSRSADSVLLIFHKNIQGLNVKMTVVRVYLFQYGKTLWRLPVSFFF